MAVVRESTGRHFLLYTGASAPTREIIESFVNRTAIAQVFHDVREVWGTGQQQVWNLWSSVVAWHVTMWLHTLTGLCDWDREAPELVHREDSPWGRADRRPSHADCRKAMQAACLA